MNLTGSAADVIKHLPVGGAHYEAAWEALNKRFNNKKLLINNNLQRLLSQKYIQNKNAEEMRHLLDTTKEIMCSLKNLGEPIVTWNSIIVFIVSQRMPPQTTELWQNQTAKSNFVSSFEELENFLENRFRTIDMLDKKSSYRSFKKRNFNVQRKKEILMSKEMK